MHSEVRSDVDLRRRRDFIYCRYTFLHNRAKRATLFGRPNGTSSTDNLRGSNAVQIPLTATPAYTGSQAATNPYRYNSGYTDPTGYIHYGNRYYNPTLANWTQQDPSGQSTGYQYAGSNPVNNSDPSGNLGSCLGSGINPFTLYSYNNGVLVSRTCYHPGPPPALTFACALAVVLSILGAGTAFVAAPGTLGGSIVAYGGAVGSAVGPAFACH